MANLGNVGASSLVKSAASIATQVADYQDKMQALQWTSSAQTDADYQQYSAYLQNRIDNLQSAGTLTDASKALTLVSTLRSANRSYVSNSIQRASIDILEGNGTLQDKQNAVVGFYQQAVANGDDNLAQNLVNSYDTINQQIQYQAKVASDAAVAQAKVDAQAQAAGYDNAAAKISYELTQLNGAFSNEGQGAVTKDLQNFVKNNQQTFKDLGIQIPQGSAANNGSILKGVFDALGTYYVNAGNALAATDPTGANTQYMKAANLAGAPITLDSGQTIYPDASSGQTSLKIGNVSLNYQEAQQYALHPDAFHQVNAGVDMNGQPVYKLAQSAVKNYTFDSKGNIQAAYMPDGNTAYAVANTNDQGTVKNDLKKVFGSSVNYNTSNGEITASVKNGDQGSGLLAQAIKKFGLDANTEFQIYKTDSGYQVAPITDNNGQQHLLTIAKDANGNFGLYSQSQSNNQNLNLIANTNGFDKTNNSSVSQGGGNNYYDALAQEFSNYANLPKGYTEKTIIPKIATEFFNGDTKTAAAAVYNFRKGLEQTQSNPQTATNPLDIAKSVLFSPSAPSTQMQKNYAYTFDNHGGVNYFMNGKAITNSQYAQGTGANITALQSQALSTYNQTNQSRINSALATAFSNYKAQPAGYTEKTVLPTIANQFYGGNIKAASTAVYQYRAANFGS